MTTAHRRALRIVAATATVTLLAAACSSSKSKSSSSVTTSAAPVTTAAGGPATTAAAGPNTASAPGITATEVKIGSHQPLTGVAAPGYSEIANHPELAFDQGPGLAFEGDLGIRVPREHLLHPLNQARELARDPVQVQPAVGHEVHHPVLGHVLARVREEERARVAREHTGWRDPGGEH